MFLLVEFLCKAVGYHFLFILFLRAFLGLLLLVLNIGLRFWLLVLAFSGVGDGIVLYLGQSLRFLSCCQGLTLFNPNQASYCSAFLLCNRIAMFVYLYAFAGLFVHLFEIRLAEGLLIHRSLGTNKILKLFLDPEGNELIDPCFLSEVGFMFDGLLQFLEMFLHSLVGEVIRGVWIAKRIIGLGPFVQTKPIVEALLSSLVEDIGVALMAAFSGLVKQFDRLHLQQ